MTAKKRILHNTIFMFGANVLRKVLTLVLTLVIARYLGVENFGKVTFALGFVALFTILLDFGAKILINREIARHRKDVNKYVSNTIVMKLVFSVVFFTMLFIITHFAGYDEPTRYLVFLAGVVFFLQSVSSALHAAFAGYEKLGYSALGAIIHSISKFVLCVMVVVQGKGVDVLLLAYIAGELIHLLASFVLYNKHILEFRFELDFAFMKDLLRRSLPFGVASLMMVLYDKIDITMLSKMTSNPDYAIGLYGAAYGLIFVLEFIPISINAAVFPHTARAFMQNKGNFKHVFERLVSYYVYMTLPIVFGTMYLATDIITLIYGQEFAPASLVFKILIWSVLFRFQMYALGIILDSMNKEVKTMQATIFSLIFNVVMNLILIPDYGIIGAAIATVGAELCYFLFASTVAIKAVGGLRIIDRISKGGLAAILMVVVMSFFELHVLLMILIGAVVYVATLLLLRGLWQEDVDLLMDYVKKIVSRASRR